MIDRLHHFFPGWALACASRARAAWPDIFIWLLGPLRLLPLNSKSWGPVKAMTTRQGLEKQPWFECRFSRDETWSIPLPHNLDPRLAKLFTGASQTQTWRSDIAFLSAGRVLGPHGAIITPDDRVLSEYSRIIGRPGKAHPALGYLHLPKVTTFSGRLAVLQVHQASNYYHWVLELLPRLGLLQALQFQVDAHYVSASAKFQRESLALAGIAPEQIIDPSNHPHLEASTLIAPTRPEIGRPSPQAITLLRELFWPSIITGKKRRIYITRRLAARRRVLNEGELEAMLANHGVEIVETERLGFQEQVQLFADAEWVIAPHGAGLANLVFCKPGAKVLELFATDYVNTCYWAVAGAADLRYHCLIDAGEGDEGIFKQGPHGRTDISVNLRQLSTILQTWENRT